MSTITILGNCATQTAEMETTSFLLASRAQRILFEAGPGVVRQLLRSGQTVTDIDTLVVTHLHADHAAGFPYLIFSMAMARQQSQMPPRDLQVIASDETMAGLQEMLSIQYPPGSYANVPLRHVRVPSGEVANFSDGHFDYRTVPGIHAVPSIGIAVEVDEGLIAYSSDTRPNMKMAVAFTDAAVLIHEAFSDASMQTLASRLGHSTAREAGEIAAAAQAKELILMHPLARFWETPEVLISEAGSAFSGPVIMPRDLDVLSWPRLP